MCCIAFSLLTTRWLKDSRSLTFISQQLCNVHVLYSFQNIARYWSKQPVCRTCCNARCLEMGRWKFETGKCGTGKWGTNARWKLQNRKMRETALYGKPYYLSLCLLKVLSTVHTVYRLLRPWRHYSIPVNAVITACFHQRICFLRRTACTTMLMIRPILINYVCLFTRFIQTATSVKILSNTWSIKAAENRHTENSYVNTRSATIRPLY